MKLQAHLLQCQSSQGLLSQIHYELWKLEYCGGRANLQDGSYGTKIYHYKISNHSNLTSKLLFAKYYA